MQLWWCGRPGQEADGSGRRRRPPAQRALGAALSEVLRDLEELRGVGERLLTAQPPAESVGAQSGGGDAEGA